MNELGRNDTCPCGSGKKYKHCCLAKPAPAKTSPRSSVTQDMQRALTLYLAGHLDQAEAICQTIAHTVPNHPEACHMLGLIALRMGNNDLATELIGRAIGAKPNFPDAHSNLGLALQLKGKLDEAAKSFRKALSLKPDFAEAHFHLGNLLRTQGKLDEAVKSYDKAIALNPLDARYRNSLGVSLYGLGRLDEAVKSYQAALSLDPDFADAHSNVGLALQEQGQLASAVDSCRKAISLKPDFAAAHNNLGIALHSLGKHDEAIKSFEKAIALLPDFADAYMNIGHSLKAMGELNAAELCYLRGIELQPDRQDFLVNRSYLSMLKGDFTGWEGYEYRALPKRAFTQAKWDGSDIHDKTILVWGEQGVGDELLYASLIPDISGAAGGCVYECDPRLMSLFARSFPKVEFIPKRDPPHLRTAGNDIAWQCPAGSLARWFRPRLESFPAHDGYLKAAPERIAYWKDRLDALGPGIKVGISWRTGNLTSDRAKYCTSLDQWGPIFKARGAVFVNLQYDECRAELEEAEAAFGITIHSWNDLNLKNELDDVAALTSALDLVISAPTAVAMMSGALGVPVWMMFVKNGDWKILGTDYYPWFPSMKVFYRDWNEDWDGVIDAVASELSLIAAP